MGQQEHVVEEDAAEQRPAVAGVGTGVVLLGGAVDLWGAYC